MGNFIHHTAYITFGILTYIASTIFFMFTLFTHSPLKYVGFVVFFAGMFLGTHYLFKRKKFN